MLQATPNSPALKQRVLKKIPEQVIKNAKGLAIFTTMRTGLWVSGAGGSGVLVGRLPSGKWSPPCGILLHTAGLGFLVGVDIYDCVLVLNSQAALDAFSKWRCTIGGEISAVAGPAGIGGLLETEVHKRQAPVFTYLKSRGFYAGVQIDGTVIIERSDENERFYGQRIPAKDILAGKAQSRDYELEVLYETLKAAQGDRNIDYKLIPDQPSPADYEVHAENHLFGVPDQEDPDPYGVLALEKEGLAIKAAGTQEVVPVEAFEFKPSINSPVYDSFRRSTDSNGTPNGKRGSWRKSAQSVSTLGDRNYSTIDMSTQTDFDAPSPLSPRLPISHSDNNRSGRHNRSIDQHVHTGIPEEPSEDYDEADNDTQTTPHISQLGLPPALPFRRPVPAIPVAAAEHEKRKSAVIRAATEPHSAELQTLEAEDAEPQTKDKQPTGGLREEDDSHDDEVAEIDQVHQVHQATGPISVTKVVVPAASVESPIIKDDEDDEFEDDEVAEIHEVHQAVAPQVITKASVVAVPKRIPPSLPQRNPGRVITSEDESTSRPTSPEAETASMVSMTRSIPSRDTSPIKPLASLVSIPRAISRDASPTKSTRTPSPLKDDASIHSSQGARPSLVSPTPSSERLHSISSATSAPLDELHDTHHESEVKEQTPRPRSTTPDADLDIPSGFPEMTPMQDEGKETSHTARVSLAGIRGSLHDDDDDALSPIRSRSLSRGFEHSREHSEDFS